MKLLDLDSALGKCVFLLGAGASFDTGCLMSNQMLENLEQILNDKHDPRLSDTEKEAIKFVIASLEYHSKWRSLDSSNNFEFSSNIEELALVIRKIKNRENFLPYPITGNWADKLVNLENKFNNESKSDWSLFESIDIKIKNKFVPFWLQHKIDKLDYLNPLIDLLSSTSIIKPIEMFSLNYDLVIEEKFKLHDTKPYRGFVSGEWNGMENKETVEEFDKINLYKLHGSLDWVRLLSDGSVRENYSKDAGFFDVDYRHEPYLVFGHGSKTFSFNPFFDLITSFKRMLQNRDYIFAIGYSFFDPYINNLIIEALNSNSNKKLVIINPMQIHNHINDNVAEYDEYTINTGGSISKIMANYIRQIQMNSFYSELPEFNLNTINGEKRIHFMKIGFDKFLQKYFLNNGNKLIEFISHFEEIRQQEENPF